ncbi:hypothetical protein I2F27_00575 [Acinetobacter sp. B5B]|uniref:hypothetical protein n=1 Tax=Acinetobacter baretiae TaxID=2605383 RepID=UPI0018C202DA|nr:hypothetical protein [Acinetobacter baretiae]MBF7681831.1 hypothetical protein [Acinetobacter baretiae]
MTVLTHLMSKIPTWLYENYAVACSDCTLVRAGMNVILSARQTSFPHCPIFIKIFHANRSKHSVEQEGHLNNVLVLHSIASAKALMSTANTLIRLISIQNNR